MTILKDWLESLPIRAKLTLFASLTSGLALITTNRKVLMGQLLLCEADPVTGSSWRNRYCSFWEMRT